MRLEVAIDGFFRPHGWATAGVRANLGCDAVAICCWRIACLCHWEFDVKDHQENEFVAFRAHRCFRGRCESMDCDRGPTRAWLLAIIVGVLFWVCVIAVVWVLL